MNFFPTSLPSLLLTALGFLACLLIAGIIIRLVLGKNSGLNQAISSSMGILLIYTVSTWIYVFHPGNLTQLISVLPMVSFRGDGLDLFSLTANPFPALCHEILSMIILAFLANALAEVFPKGKHVLSWLFYRILTVLLAMVVHYLVHVLFELLIPGFLDGYAPMILLSILIFMLSLGFLKLILGLILVAVNPVIGALYGFFFGNKTGKQLSRAVLTTLVLCALLYLLEKFGYGSLAITAASLKSSIPATIVILILWYILGCAL